MSDPWELALPWTYYTKKKIFPRRPYVVIDMYLSLSLVTFNIRESRQRAFYCCEKELLTRLYENEGTGL